ncbi:MAG TPA: hypothetical protein VJ921_06265, partial [Vicinamibacteria bacterium]|nr:hypothetical protein [Vicinamibacteria bacterium]
RRAPTRARPSTSTSMATCGKTLLVRVHRGHGGAAGSGFQTGGPSAPAGAILPASRDVIRLRGGRLQ